LLYTPISVAHSENSRGIPVVCLGPHHLSLSGGRSELRLAANPDLQMAPSSATAGAAAEHNQQCHQLLFSMSP
jgi:hypothetical protein